MLHQESVIDPQLFQMRPRPRFGTSSSWQWSRNVTSWWICPPPAIVA